MNKGDNVRLRADGRYEARYIKTRDESGKPIYGYCYGRTECEAREKRDYQLKKITKPREMNLLILGAGDHGRDVAELAKDLHVFNRIDFLDDNPYRENVVGRWDDAAKFLEKYPLAFVAVADEMTRRTWMDRLSVMGFIIPVLVHPTAFISEGTEIGRGSVICAKSNISSGVKIGEGCIINTGSTVPRKSVIPDWGYFELDRCIEHYREEYQIPQISDRKE